MNHAEDARAKLTICLPTLLRKLYKSLLLGQFITFFRWAALLVNKTNFGFHRDINPCVVGNCIIFDAIPRVDV